MTILKENIDVETMGIIKNAIIEKRKDRIRQYKRKIAEKFPDITEERIRMFFTVYQALEILDEIDGK